ncbi:MAG: HEPN domain-containing protein [Bryobacterales bacterium]|nr:HEPN domain-containing protein [Bryobacterales bacterium]
MPRHSEIPGSPQEWLVRAKGDLAMARIALPEGAHYEDLCFHAQQAAEKAVKAVYRARKLKFAYIHDIAELLAGLEREGIQVPQSVLESAVLSDFAWQARYPGTAEPVDEAEYRDALMVAEATVKWAEDLVNRGTS